MNRKTDREGDLKTLLLCDCVAFTLLVLIYSGLNLLGFTHPLTPVLALQFFVTTTMVSILITITHRFSYPSPLLQMAVEIGGIFLIVIGMGGGLFKFFEFEALDLLIVSGMNLLIYIGTYGVLLLKSRNDAEQINRKLTQMKEKRNDNGTHS